MSDLKGESDPLLDTSINQNVEEQTFVKKDDLLEILDIEEEKNLPIWRMILLTISFSGCIMCWSVEIAYATAFLEEIGLSKNFVSYNWLFGPLSALFVQPVVGALSDKIFIPFVGRRKPLLVFGAVCCGVCLLTFSWADQIAYLFIPHHKEARTIVGIAIALVSFMVLDGSINTLHSACKTLVIDCVPLQQQTSVNLYLSFFAGFGNAFGFCIGYIDFVNKLGLKFLGNNIRPVYGICCAWLVFSCSLTFWSTWEKKDVNKQQKQILKEKMERIKNENQEKEEGKEEYQKVESYDEKDELEEGGEEIEEEKGKEQLVDDFEFGKDDDEDDDDDALPRVVVKRNSQEIAFDFGSRITLKIKKMAFDHWKFFTTFPTGIIRAYWVRFFIYFAKFFTFVYLGDFVGRQIYHGTPEGSKTIVDRFNAGVRWGSLCMGVLSIFNMINSPIINFLARLIPIRVIWCCAQSTQFLGLFACYWVNNKWIFFLIFYLLSYMETCCISFPYAILNANLKKNPYLKKNKGLAAGIFVSSQCFPEIIVSLVGGLFVKLFIDTWNLHSGIMLSCGGCCAGIAFILILFIEVPDGMVQKIDVKEEFIKMKNFVLKISGKQKKITYEVVDDDEEEGEIEEEEEEEEEDKGNPERIQNKDEEVLQKFD